MVLKFGVTVEAWLAPRILLFDHKMVQMGLFRHYCWSDSLNDAFESCFKLKEVTNVYNTILLCFHLGEEKKNEILLPMHSSDILSISHPCFAHIVVFYWSCFPQFVMEFKLRFCVPFSLMKLAMKFQEPDYFGQISKTNLAVHVYSKFYVLYVRILISIND